MELTKPYTGTPRQEGVRFSFICLFIHLFPACLQKGFEVGRMKNRSHKTVFKKKLKGQLEILGVCSDAELPEIFVRPFLSTGLGPEGAGGEACLPVSWKKVPTWGVTQASG